MIHWANEVMENRKQIPEPEEVRPGFIRVAVVEDDDKIRSSLVVLIEGSHGFRCVASYENAESALADLPRKDPDVVLVDINLPVMQGIDLVRNLHAVHSGMQFIMLTVYEETDKIF